MDSSYSMIAHITGTIAAVALTHVVVDVRGIGYLVAVSGKSAYLPGQTCTLFTYLAVRENALDLYGFDTTHERSVFEALIKIPKIGPKTAMAILSQADMAILSRAVASDDAVYLSKMSGIGKKSAEKIVAGLRDILGEDGFADGGPAPHSRDTDVVDALVALGYSERDAAQAIQRIAPETEGTNARITEALKHISR